MKRTPFQWLFILSLLISACASNTDGPKTPQALQPTAVSTALFQVIRVDGTKVGVTIADLKTLPLKQVTVDGKVEIQNLSNGLDVEMVGGPALVWQ